MSISIRSQTPQNQTPKVEIAWFGDLCNGDFRVFGRPDSDLRSNWEHCSEIINSCDELGYQNILLPSSYVPGQDVMTFAAGVAPRLRQMSLLTALRMGEYHPPMLARSIATLDHMLKGKLTINIISSDLPGEKMESEPRYRRSREVIQILQQGWTRDEIDFRGEFYNLKLPTKPVKTYQQSGGPLLYFGGISEPARDLCAEFCDVFLMWPETIGNIANTMQDLSTRAEKYGRKIDFGYRVHIICRETESQARQAASDLMAGLSDDRAKEIKHRTQDSQSAGVLRQDALRASADSDGYIEDYLWSGIGRGRSGCGSAIVGDPDQVFNKLQEYINLGIRSFILSGYPLINEAKIFAKYVLPRLSTCKLAVEQGRLPNETPVTPLTTGARG